MNRKKFIENLIKSGTAFFCSLSLPYNSFQQYKDKKKSNQTIKNENWIEDLEKRMIKGSETPAWLKVEKSENWIKDLMSHMDSMINKDTKIKLMQECGRSCYIRAFGVAPEEKPESEQAKEYIERLKTNGYKVEKKGNKTTVIFNWGENHQKPTGLIMKDGYCMCDIVESGPVRLSPSFCYCSTGYIKEIFERRTGKQVKVDLIDSLKMGGKDCIFKVEIEDI